MAVYDGMLLVIPGRDIYLAPDQLSKLYASITTWKETAKPGDYYILNFEDAGLRAYSHLEAPAFPISPTTNRDNPIVIMSGVKPGNDCGQAYSITAGEFMRVFSYAINMPPDEDNVRYFGYDDAGQLAAARIYDTGERVIHD